MLKASSKALAKEPKEATESSYNGSKAGLYGIVTNTFVRRVACFVASAHNTLDHVV